MSIILKGIDMPEDVHGKTVLDEIRLIFSNANTRYSILLDKDDIVEIPTPHGILIDGDELVKHLRKDPLFDLVERYGISGVIESRPTILDKERE